MIQSNRNTGLFPKSTEILGTLGFTPLEQNYFLSGGKIHAWTGPMNDIHSPVYFFKEDKHEKIRLGSVPIFSASQAIDVLQDAVNAWDLGRGEWPVMRVKDRIKAVEHFLELYKKQREKVVRWLMLEIGKNRSESEQEFDRTSDYISDTINSVKQLDRDSSNLELNSGNTARISAGLLKITLAFSDFEEVCVPKFSTICIPNLDE